MVSEEKLVGCVSARYGLPEGYLQVVRVEKLACNRPCLVRQVIIVGRVSVSYVFFEKIHVGGTREKTSVQ